MKEISGMLSSIADKLTARFDGHVMVIFLRASMNIVFNFFPNRLIC